MSDIKDIIINVGHALYGERWQTSLARDLGYKSPALVKAWLEEPGTHTYRRPPHDLLARLYEILVNRQLAIDESIALCLDTYNTRYDSYIKR